MKTTMKDSSDSKTYFTKQYNQVLHLLISFDNIYLHLKMIIMYIFCIEMISRDSFI